MRADLGGRLRGVEIACGVVVSALWVRLTSTVVSSGRRSTCRGWGFGSLGQGEALVQVNAASKILNLHKFDLAKLLADSKVNYLFIDSRPERIARRGKTYKTQLQVKAKKERRNSSFSACLAKVPITSSASQPGLAIIGIPVDLRTSSILGI